LAASNTAQKHSPISLSSDDFDALMAANAPFEDSPHIAVAVSGGPDSMALAVLLHGWVERQGGRLTVLTVDHGLRPESKTEARHVAERVAGWKDTQHHIISWTGEKPDSGLQQTARHYRYHAMEEKCRELGILHLAVAHHLDDQAETFFMRLASGSGLDGLCGMSSVRETGHVRLIRPLLSVPKARLIETCRAEGLEWFEDPSNANLNFARGRLRTYMSALSEEGLTPERLDQVMSQFRRSRNALEVATARVMSRAVSLYPEGYATLKMTEVSGETEEIRLRVLKRLLVALSGEIYVPRSKALQRLYDLMWGEGLSFTGHTLHGCVITPLKAGVVLFCREESAIEAPKSLAVGVETVWDARFRVMADCEGLQVSRLGEDGLQQLEDKTGLKRKKNPELAKIPVPVRPTLPAFWRGEELITIPGLNMPEMSENVGNIRFLPPIPLIRPILTVD